MRSSRRPMRLLPRAVSQSLRRFPSTHPLLLQLFHSVFLFSFLFLSVLFHSIDSSGNKASINDQRRACREFRGIGSKIENRRGDFLVRANSSDRNDPTDLIA